MSAYTKRDVISQEKKDEAWKRDMENLQSAISSMDFVKLRTASNFMKKHGKNVGLRVPSTVKLQFKQSDPAQNGIKIYAHPLCVFLERIKLMPEKVMDEAMRVGFDEWQPDLNMEFQLEEKRPDAPPGVYNPGDVWSRMSGRLPPELFLKFDMTSNPISWLFYLRYGDRRNDSNVHACMIQLLKRGANTNAPFRFTFTERPENPPMRLSRRLMQKVTDRDEGYAALNGHSLLYAAMKSRFDLNIIDLLFVHGARFNKNDKHPFATFMDAYCNYPHNVDSHDVVLLFHKYWKLGQVTAAEILSPEELVKDENDDGDTAMHIFLRYPSERDSDATLGMLLEMGFRPSTPNAAGKTVAEWAIQMISERPPYPQASTGIKLKLAHRLLVIDFETRYATANVAAAYFTKNRDLPPEIVTELWSHLDLGPRDNKPAISPGAARAVAARKAARKAGDSSSDSD
jgi:hypothetical protein